MPTEPAFNPELEETAMSPAPDVSSTQVGPPPTQVSKDPDPAVKTQDEVSESLLSKAGSVAVDMGKGLLAGAEGAVKGARQTARGIADATGLSDLVGDRDTNAKPLTDLAPQPEGVMGEITSNITRAALGYVVGGVAVKGAGLLSQMGKSVIGTPLIANPDQERISNMLAHYPWLEPLVSPLAQDPTDSVLVSKVKAGLEDVLTTAAASSILKGFQVLYGKAVGKGADPVIQATEASIAKEAAKAGSDTNPLVLSNPKLSDKATGFKQIPVEKLKVIDSMHPDAVDPKKVQTIQDALAGGKGKQIPPIDVQANAQGGFNVVDGRHRLEAAKAAGHTSITANVQPTVAPKPPLVVQMPDGSSGVVLSANKQAEAQKLIDKIVIRDTVQGSTMPAPHPSSAKVGTMAPQNLEAPNGVLQAMESLGKFLKPQLDSLGPVYRSVDETKEMAAILGVNPESLIANIRGSNIGLENIDAIATGGRMLLQTKGVEMFAASRKALLSGDPLDKEAFNKVMLETAELSATMSEIATRLGRGLRSFGESVGPFDSAAMKKLLNNPEEAEKMARLMAATNGNADQVMHILKMQQMSFADKLIGTHNEYWSGLGLLSRASTQLTNILSTGWNTLMEPTSMLVGGTLRGATGQGWSEAREAIGIYAGLKSSIFDSMHMAWQAMKTDRAILSSASTNEFPSHYISALTYNMDPNTWGGKVIDIMGNITRASFRGLTAGDEFFKQLSYRAKVSATATREAMDMVRAGSLPKNQVESFVRQRLQDSINEAGGATVPAALRYAEKTTFTSDLKGPTWFGAHSMGEVMAQAAGHPVIRGTILPFVKTPTNVMRTTFEYTPIIGQMRKAFYKDIQEGGEKAALAIGKLTLGSAMYTGAAMLSLDGRITGSPPPPGVMLPPGWRPYSVVWHNDDGSTTYISYQRLQPFADILGLTADFTRASGMIDAAQRDELAAHMTLGITKFLDGAIGDQVDTVAGVGVNASAAYGKSLISKTYFRNLTEFFSTFSGYNNEAATLRWFQNYTASHIPGFLAQFNGDETIREVRGIMDAIYARIPGLSSTLPPRRDYFGHVQDVKVGLPWSIIQPLSVTRGKEDAVAKELVRLSNSSAELKYTDIDHLSTIAGQKVDLKAVKNEKGVTAWDHMNDLMQTVTPPGENKNFYDKLKSVIESPRYQYGVESKVLDGAPMAIGLRASMVKAEEKKYRDEAFRQMKDDFAKELGIKSALSEQIATDVGRKKVRAGIYDKILDLNK